MDAFETNSILNHTTMELDKDGEEIFERQSSESILNVALRALRILPIVKKVNTVDLSTLPEITLKDVGNHDHYNDCWIVLYDRVYDVTDFLKMHPGGADVMLDHCGRDATLAFHGTGHSKSALLQLNQYVIGQLPLNERIFRKSTGNAILSGIPD